MTSYSAMVNAWSLLYDEIYGDDEMSPCSTDHVYYDSDQDIVVGLSTASAHTFNIDAPPIENISIDFSVPQRLFEIKTIGEKQFSKIKNLHKNNEEEYDIDILEI